MEEKKKPAILTILFVLVGLCLVGFGVWSGIKYFKEDKELTNDDNYVIYSKEEESQESIDDDMDILAMWRLEMNGNKLEIPYNVYLKNDQLISSIKTNVSKIKSDEFEYKNKILTIDQYKFTGVDDEVETAFIYGGCCGGFDAYVLTKNGDLYYNSFGLEDKEIKLSKINKNTSSIQTKDGGRLYFKDNQDNYYIIDSFGETSEEYTFKIVDESELFRYQPFSGKSMFFNLNDIKNGKVYFNNIGINTVLGEDEGSAVESLVVVIDNNNYAYIVSESYEDSSIRFEKIGEKKVKTISTKEVKGDDEYTKKIAIIEFES